MPFIRNFNRKTAMHLCKEQTDFRAINMFIEYLSAYGIDHHSRAIVDLLPMMIEHSLPNLPDYLESRVKQTEYAAKLKRGLLRKQSP